MVDWIDGQREIGRLIKFGNSRWRSGLLNALKIDPELHRLYEGIETQNIIMTEFATGLNSKEHLERDAKL